MRRLMTPCLPSSHAAGDLVHLMDVPKETKDREKNAATPGGSQSEATTAVTVRVAELAAVVQAVVAASISLGSPPGSSLGALMWPPSLDVSRCLLLLLSDGSTFASCLFRLRKWRSSCSLACCGSHALRILRVPAHGS